MNISTERLIIRDFLKGDADSLVENLNDLDVSRTLLKVPFPFKKSDATKWIERCIEEGAKNPRTDYSLAIELKGRGGVVGSIALVEVDSFSGTAKTGYWLAKKCWRQGFMTEAMDAILEFSFGKLGLRRIESGAFVGNVASASVLKKAGFVYEGRLRQACRAVSTGEIHDEDKFGLLVGEWRKKHNKA